MDCMYTITVEEGKVVALNFTQFALELSRPCIYDWLEISDGPDRNSHRIGRFCGTVPPGNNGSLITTRNAVHMWFRSDSSYAHHGFRVRWNASEPVCGGVIRGLTHGSVNSPGYPGEYPHNRDCTWTIYAPLGKRVQFHFAHLSIETHNNCSFDYVDVGRIIHIDFLNTNCRCPLPLGMGRHIPVSSAEPSSPLL